MATDRNLPASHTFRLNDDAASLNDGKIYVFVKLTDSCMKTIETFIRQGKKFRTNNSSNKASIKFSQHGGEMHIPTNNDQTRTYSFQIAPEDKTPEVFECLRQANLHQLQSCGLIEQRLNIHAQEDVYSMTKTKVTEYQKNEEQNKKQTKEIGESSKSILQKKTNKSSTKRPTISNEHNASPATTIPTGASERPLRERLVHLLAARVYRKPDLLLRLKNDGGIRDDEKEQLDSLLSSITTQSKSGDLVLSKSILLSGDVSSDWPFYAKGEGTLVRKKIKEQQANVARASTLINSKPNDSPVASTSSSVRSSLPTPLSKATAMGSVPVKATPPAGASSHPSTRPSIFDEPNLSENEETTISTHNVLSDDRMQELSDMLDTMTSAMSDYDKTKQQFSDEIELNDEEAELQYNRLVPEYNQLIDYFTSISEKFSRLQQQFNDEQNHSVASTIVDQFWKCEEHDHLLTKRKRLFELHFKLNHFRRICLSSLSADENSDSMQED